MNYEYQKTEKKATVSMSILTYKTTVNLETYINRENYNFQHSMSGNTTYENLFSN